MDETKPKDQVRNIMLALAETRWHMNYSEFCQKLGMGAPGDDYTRRKWDEFNELARAFSPWDAKTLTGLLEKYWPEKGEEGE